MKQITWFQMLVYKLFFVVWTPLLEQRMDLVLLLKKHIDRYVEKQTGIVNEKPSNDVDDFNMFNERTSSSIHTKSN